MESQERRCGAWVRQEGRRIEGGKGSRGQWPRVSHEKLDPYFSGVALTWAKLALWARTALPTVVPRVRLGATLLVTMVESDEKLQPMGSRTMVAPALVCHFAILFQIHF